MSDTLPQVCAVVTEATVDAARQAMRQASGIADLIELRLDYLQDFDFSDERRLASLLDGKPLPVIITCRAASEGEIHAESGDAADRCVRRDRPRSDAAEDADRGRQVARATLFRDRRAIFLFNP